LSKVSFDKQQIEASTPTGAFHLLKYAKSKVFFGLQMFWFSMDFEFNKLLVIRVDVLLSFIQSKSQSIETKLLSKTFMFRHISFRGCTNKAVSQIIKIKLTGYLVCTQSRFFHSFGSTLSLLSLLSYLCLLKQGYL